MITVRVSHAFLHGIRAAPFTALKATPGVNVPDETIDGFPEFAFTSSDPEVEAKLTALAKRIVASHQAGRKKDHRL